MSEIQIFPNPDVMTQEQILAWLDEHNPVKGTVVRNILDDRYQMARRKFDRIPFTTETDQQKFTDFLGAELTEYARKLLKRIIFWMKNDRAYRLPTRS